MAQPSTFVKLDRNITKWRWYQDSNTFRVWIHLLLNANIEDHDFEKITVHRGELVTSRKRLSEDLSLSEQQIRTSLNKLISTNEITNRGYAKYTVISLTNYALYQGIATNKTTNNQPTDNQQVTTIKEYKNVRSKENKVYNNILVDLSDDKTTPDPLQTEKINYKSIVDCYNSVCSSLPKVREITDSRKKAIKNIAETVNNYGGFESFFQTVEASDFLCGRSEKTWTGCSFDWIMKRANAVKILEGNYNNRGEENDASRTDRRNGKTPYKLPGVIEL